MMRVGAFMALVVVPEAVFLLGRRLPIPVKVPFEGAIAQIEGIHS